MDLDQINSVYFLGIGGIGMSSLARYFHAQGFAVNGYDRTSTPLTKELEQLGIQVHYTENVAWAKDNLTNIESTLIIRTPAVPEDHQELIYFNENRFHVLKRAQVLGLLFNSKKGIAIAGTHGKTSVCTFTSFLMKEAGVDCSAFLGGISKNYQSNLLLGGSDYVIAEADEFDRSFLQLHPYITLVTTIDKDHLDIYKDFNDIKDTFRKFIEQTDHSGVVILNKSIDIEIKGEYKIYTYALENSQADFYTSNTIVVDGAYEFTLNTPDGKLEGFRLNVPGKTNVENTVAAIAVAWCSGIKLNELKSVLPKLKGVVRRFDVHYKDSEIIYIDDYAHHPREIDAVVDSLRDIYKGKRITAVFQPHLFSRTRDFAEEFAASLSNVDELVLLDIYPAREKPLPGVDSDMLFEMVNLDKKHRCSKVNLLRMLKGLNIEVLLTIGAGDIDQFVEPIKNMITERAKG